RGVVGAAIGGPVAAGRGHGARFNDRHPRRGGWLVGVGVGLFFRRRNFGRRAFICIGVGIGVGRNRIRFRTTVRVDFPGRRGHCTVAGRERIGLGCLFIDSRLGLFLCERGALVGKIQNADRR